MTLLAALLSVYPILGFKRTTPNPNQPNANKVNVDFGCTLFFCCRFIMIQTPTCFLFHTVPKINRGWKQRSNFHCHHHASGSKKPHKSNLKDQYPAKKSIETFLTHKRNGP
jgi:hypothetical protein